MANYSVLKAAVQAVVKTNGNAEITGANMQSTLLSIINSVGAGYQFMGIATTSTSPGTPDYNVFYIGGAGTYANFGTSVTVPVGSICVFKYNGSWTKEQIALFAGIDDVPTAGSNKLVKSGGVYENTACLSLETLTLTQTSDKYINFRGEIGIANGFAYTQNFTLKNGETIIIRGAGTGTNIAMLSKADGNTYTPLIISTDSNVSTWEYTNMNEDAQFALSYNYTKEHYCKKLVNSQLIALDERINQNFENLESEISVITDKTDNIIKLQNGQFSVYGTTITIYEYGGISVIGTATRSGGRTTKLCQPFQLQAGTYSYVVDGSPSSLVVIENAANDAIIALPSSPTFTLENATSVYVGVNVVSGTTYSDNIGIALYNGTSVNEYMPTITAKDLIARQEIINVDNKNVTTSTETLTLTETQDKYINFRGEIGTANGFAYTQNFTLKNGEAIIIRGAGTGTNVAMLSKVNGNTYTPLIISADSNVSTWAYTNMGADAEFALSYNYTKEHSCTKVVDTQITALENAPVITSSIQMIFAGIPIMGIIGDSLSSGVTYDENNVSHQDYNFAWWQVLKRDSGAQYIYFAEGGLTTRSWLTSSVGLSKALTAGNECCAYVIALGVNDQWSLGPSYIGSSSDIKQDPSQNEDTFYGNYGKIIQLLTANVPKAKFFALTVPRRTGSYNEFNAAIRNIAEIFDNCYLVDLEANYYDIFQSSFIVSQTFGGSHHSAMAYQYIGKIMEKAIGDTIEANSVDFRYIQFALNE